MKKLSVPVFLIFFLMAGGAGVLAKDAELLQWEQVNEMIPRYSKFIVQDLETGLKFKVQRRAGSRHADVQPLTAQDTKIMKEIYGGKWSWKRRAIYVLAKKRKIAASMHGMPHGAGALKNNFPGHFCIHFYGSTTHRTNAMDLSHKLMMLKAAGRLDDYLEESGPHELAQAYLAGIKQHDIQVVSLISLTEMKWEPVFSEIENISVDRVEILPDEDFSDQLTVSVPVEIKWARRGRGPRHFRGNIELVRFSPEQSWKIDSVPFFKENEFLP
ncbi:hypothetical protein [Bacillus sp. FJAT-27251]|uniref:hypothetical protein n=1 Tax=Bacillus sp. FJAT-27251 TaxID=1684142 RepID=UPI0006A797C3|nr:hypothetical protein [Bacillus sp. FJAT-27251]